MNLAPVNKPRIGGAGRVAVLVAIVALVTPVWARAQDQSDIPAQTPGVPLLPQVAAPEPLSRALDLSSQPEPRPVTKRWWFWTAVGAVVAVTAVILILANRKDAAPATTLGDQEFAP